ncbi:MAG: hypothetical protein QHH17_06760 [Candidatus Bathyarchaeota archaeon]|jgi:hypothetical protein|nr:hypothetical protein [Candidatus Bathyarchaeota archaeon]
MPTEKMVVLASNLCRTYEIGDLKVEAWLLMALAATFIFSLYPAIKFSKKPLIEVMA